MASPAEISSLVGSTSILIYCGCGLYGILCAQAFECMNNFPDDPKLLKTASAAVMILETIHTSLTIISLYIYTVSAAADPLSILGISWNTGAVCVVEIFIVLIVQGYFIRRVWLLSDGRRTGLVLVIILSALVIARCGFELATAIYIWSPSTNTWISFRKTRASYLSYSGWLAFATVGDVGIAAVLSYYLWKKRSAVRSTNNIIRRTMAFTLNSGAITAAVALGGLIAFFMSNSLANTGILVIASKLYANSFFGMLNARHFARRDTVRIVQDSEFSFPTTDDGSQNTAEIVPVRPRYLNALILTEFSLEGDKSLPVKISKVGDSE
ncbi:hypothetical protein BXZ70DRAFT_1007594 [Cristinia sonorae]|uniref:DUF6534 domain-containing protein n=1 Tax=Cristinia sonorae TaxID=1940300 RepID=A0A8K0UQJ8_9AGAR|nr:hypothetical protein BXZ70DRAFT_1007594 [Cristinia sonorae]